MDTSWGLIDKIPGKYFFLPPRCKAWWFQSNLTAGAGDFSYMMITLGDDEGDNNDDDDDDGDDISFLSPLV